MKFFRMLRRSIRDAFKSVFRNFSLSLASISCITITLIIVAISIIVTFNVQNFTKEMEKDLTIVVFLDTDTTEEEVEKIRDRLESMSNVESLTYQSKASVKEEMSQENEVFNEVMSTWDDEDNPLKDTFQVKVKVVEEIAYSDGERSKVKCYGANDVREGVAIMWLEDVDVSITGNSTNPTRFQHPVAGTYKKERIEAGKKYFSVASGGGTGRTLHPDNMAAGPASYGMTDTMGRMHSDAQFAGSSSVPAHVEMMGLIGMGNNPMVGASVAVAVAVEEAMK